MRLALVAAAVVLVAAGLGGAFAAGAFGSGSGAPRSMAQPPPPPDEAEIAAIRQLVLTAASNMGDRNPTDGILVPTTRRRAELVDVDTAESDFPVYFVLVRGHFTDYAARIPKGAEPPTGTILTLTIDPRTNESLDTGLVGAMPDVKAMGEPEPLPLSDGAPTLRSDLRLTKNVPCPNGHQRTVGPAAVRGFHAVTAVSCVDTMRTYPEQGQWEVLVRRVAVSSVSGLQQYFEQRSERNLPKGMACTDNLVITLVPVFVDVHGRRLVPQTPVDGCHKPLDGGPPAVRWDAVSVHKVKLIVSAPALAAHCAMGIKDLPAGGIGPLDPSAGGPLFRSTPKTVHVCIYRTLPNDFEVGNFVRGFRLDAALTRRLLGAMKGAAPSGSCPDERVFAVVSAAEERWVEVELGGCWRVGRTYPDYGLGGADPSVSAILGGR